MKVARESEKVQEFIVANVEYFRSIGMLALPYRIIEDVNGYLRLMIEFGEDLSDEQLRSALPYLRAIREKLMDFQGPEIQGNANFMLEHYSQRQEQSESYATLVKEINQLVATHAKTAAYVKKKGDEASPEESKQAWDALKALGMIYDVMYSKERKQSKSGQSQVKKRSKSAGNERGAWKEIFAAIERTIAGDQPFAEGYPFSQERLIRVLRTWRDGKRQKLKDKPHWNFKKN